MARRGGKRKTPLLPISVNAQRDRQTYLHSDVPPLATLLGILRGQHDATPLKRSERAQGEQTDVFDGEFLQQLETLSLRVLDCENALDPSVIQRLGVACAACLAPLAGPNEQETAISSLLNLDLCAKPIAMRQLSCHIVARHILDTKSPEGREHLTMHIKTASFAEEVSVRHFFFLFHFSFFLLGKMAGVRPPPNMQTRQAISPCSLKQVLLFFSTTFIEEGRKRSSSAHNRCGLSLSTSASFDSNSMFPNFSFGCFLNCRQERGGRPGMMSRELMKASCCLASLLSARHDFGSNAGLTKQMARLGSFLGAVTLRVNRPIFSAHLDIRKFLSEALVLSAVDPAIALVCNVMKHAPYSKIFSSAKNPWIRRVEMTRVKKV